MGLSLPLVSAEKLEGKRRLLAVGFWEMSVLHNRRDNMFFFSFFLSLVYV